MIQVAYTNSKCSDLWYPFITINEKSTSLPLFMISDTDVNNENVTQTYVYKEDEPYYQVWCNALQQFNNEYFILYGETNHHKLLEYLKFLQNNPQYSFIRLIKSGQLENVRVTDTLFEIEPSNEDIFSMQATIWRTSDYIKLLETVKDPKWLENSKYRDACIALNLRGLYHYDGEKKRGRTHWDSNVYPYIATALVRGKWNLVEYPDELKTILNEYNINPNKRGIHR